ncbi:hypothetical protein Scep_019271 [Stephania cephalantha]|uniref:Uncharacterized protein n=1 Tax=Stephania cephalantha TaxID=152367 RepID=A0AAP0IB12_9MAGN
MTNNSDDDEGFRGSDGRRRGFQSQRRQMARASEAATADGEGFIGIDVRWRGLHRQRRQTTRPPVDTTKTRRLNHKAKQQLNPQPPKP